MQNQDKKETPISDIALDIKEMKESDYKNVVKKWMIAEEWNPIKLDYEVYFAINQDEKASKKEKNYYYVLKNLKKDGEIISSLLIHVYNESFAFLGAYITKKEERGHGYGLRLWNYAMKAVRAEYANICIGLFSVRAQVSTYMKSGFRVQGRIYRYEKTVEAKMTDYVTLQKTNLTHALLDKIVSFDEKAFPPSRQNFIRAVIVSTGNHSSGGKVLIAKKNEQLTGFMVIRPCEKGYRVGPFEAVKYKTANSLLSNAMRLQGFFRPGDYIYLDANDTNTKVVELTSSYGFSRNQSTFFEAMYTGKPPINKSDLIYAEPSLELL